MKHYLLAAPVFALACVLAGPLAAQEAAPSPPEAKPEASAGPERPEAKPGERPERRPPARLVRLQIVLARSEGEKKTASIPYVVVAATDDWGHLRMGVEVPIAVGHGESFQYRSVGTNIDSRVRIVAGDRYEVGLSVENTSIYGRPEEAGKAHDATIVSDRPMFRSFKASLSLVLRDGQSVQTVASTDPVTGEVTTIDVTLHVVK